MPEPEKDKSYNFLLASTKAFFEVARNVRILSYDSTVLYQDKLYADYRSLLDEETYDRSISLGDQIAEKILQRVSADQYKQTRGMEKIPWKQRKGVNLSLLSSTSFRLGKNSTNDCMCQSYTHHGSVPYCLISSGVRTSCEFFNCWNYG